MSCISIKRRNENPMDRFSKELMKQIENDLKGKDHLVIKFKSYYVFEDMDIPVKEILQRIAVKYTNGGHICKVYKEDEDTCITFSFIR